MFCTNCGQQLSDGARFCIHCGAKVELEPLPQEETVQPVDEMPPVSEAPAEEPAYIPPVQQPAYMPPVQPQYAQPIVPEKPKKKKTGMIIAIILAAVLVLGGVGAFLFIQYQNQQAYDAAVAMLEERDYDGALAAFEELGGFSDAEEQAQELRMLQEDYDAALALVEEQEYEEAIRAFQKLKDYRDSKEYADNKVMYERAYYLMESAETGDADALLLLEDADAIPTGDEGAVKQVLYSFAADGFANLGEYQDAKTLASKCWLQEALIFLNWGEFDAAMEYVARLTDEDAAILNAAYQEACADGQFLADIASAYGVWMDDADELIPGEELGGAMAIVEPYLNQNFDDETLQGYMYDVVEALELMMSSLDTAGDYIYDYVTYYEGMAAFYDAADKLHNAYSIFAGNSDYIDWFVGREDVRWYPVIEADLQDWWVDATAYPAADGHYYVEYTNDSGCDFVLYVYVYFYDDYDNLLEISDELEIYVEDGATVSIPTIPNSISDDDWSYFGMDWWFGVA